VSWQIIAITISIKYQKIPKSLAIGATENTELHIKIPKHLKIYQNQTNWISGTVGDNYAQERTLGY
jgi:hypothetical protein